MEEHVQGSTEEKFLCVVAHYRIEYRPHAAISAHRVTSSREIGMRKRKYRCLSRCGAPENLISPKDASNGALATVLPSFLSHFVFSSPHGTAGAKTPRRIWIEMTNAVGTFCPFFESRFPCRGTVYADGWGKMEKLKLYACFSFFFFFFFGSGDNSSLQ